MQCHCITVAASLQIRLQCYCKMDALSLQCLSADSYMVMPRGGNVQ
ncbi:hypothetical protein BACUNI_03109 [Bacteroides uniformis ATCC 8492]|uniref:Uncharacterized protein n=1 Tax=Bacteroides uniformis (strain ATCC 8492 / DSM 6597 / CCUG 4942 / CIP 103695 / JCM 5828 / KCTC 5204 / NCTC 13054 / VPI 0061) TaxID=411479 RepID=A0ABC9N8N5_BACUC|nr:hypothetical protein BACUNI_03109 [Bacteroides uniformis ATCC 8492]